VHAHTKISCTSALVAAVDNRLGHGWQHELADPFSPKFSPPQRLTHISPVKAREQRFGGVDVGSPLPHGVDDGAMVIRVRDTGELHDGERGRTRTRRPSLTKSTELSLGSGVFGMRGTTEGEARAKSWIRHLEMSMGWRGDDAGATRGPPVSLSPEAVAARSALRVGESLSPRDRAPDAEEATETSGHTPAARRTAPHAVQVGRDEAAGAWSGGNFREFSLRTSADPRDGKCEVIAAAVCGELVATLAPTHVRVFDVQSLVENPKRSALLWEMGPPEAGPGDRAAIPPALSERIRANWGTFVEALPLVEEDAVGNLPWDRLASSAAMAAFTLEASDLNLLRKVSPPAPPRATADLPAD